MGEVNIEALSGVDFTVDKGEFVVVAGASGAGKSTILNILGGMDSPTSGEIIVDNNKINKYSNKKAVFLMPAVSRNLKTVFLASFLSR